MSSTPPSKPTEICQSICSYIHPVLACVLRFAFKPSHRSSPSCPPVPQKHITQADLHLPLRSRHTTAGHLSRCFQVTCSKRAATAISLAAKQFHFSCWLAAEYSRVTQSQQQTKNQSLRCLLLPARCYY